MIRPRPGEMNYKKESELAGYCMFIASCLSEHEKTKLKERWMAQGGYKITPWWKFVKNNTKLELDLLR